jgi:hypothetical protein
MQQQVKFVNKGLNQINIKVHIGKIMMEPEEWFHNGLNQEKLI